MRQLNTRRTLITEVIKVSRQRWISHYVRRIPQVLNNVVAPAISLTFRNLVATSNTQVLMNHAQLDPPSSQIPEFRRGEEVHDDSVAYEFMDADGHFHPTSELIFNDQDYTDLRDHDNNDCDSACHDVRTPVPKVGDQSVTQVFTIRHLPTNQSTDALNLDDSAGSSNSVFDADIDAIAASTNIVPPITADQHRIDDNTGPINHVAHFTNIPAISNGPNTQASLPKSAVDDVSSTFDSTTDGSTLKKRKLPTNDTSGSHNGVIYEIAERVKQRRRPVTKKEVQQAITTLDSSGSIRHV